MKFDIAKLMWRTLCLVVALLLAACGGGVGNPTPVAPGNSYTVGGTVSGLSGTVVLQNNHGDNVTRTSNGAFSFANPVAGGSTYSVSVLTQPSGQTCSVANGTGTISAAAVTNVAVSCTTTATQAVSVTINPQVALVATSGTRTFIATVNGAGNTAVTWSVQEGVTGGSVTGTGQYTAPAHAGTYHVIATSLADATKSASATVTVNDPTPVTGAPMTTANRVSGVAPLAVFFDAVDTTAATTTACPIDNSHVANCQPMPYTWSSGVFQPADILGSQYEWNFGDIGSGSWSLTNQSKNAATGPTAAHVFENPGTYTVSLTLTDTAGVVNTYVQTITVAAFSGTTYYVAANGSDTNNDGLSESAPFATLARGVTAVNGGPGRQLLLRRGDTFEGPTTTLSLTAAGPSIVGAYGTGSAPIVHSNIADDCNGAPGLLSVGSEWRVMDIDIRNDTSTNCSANAAVGLRDGTQTMNALVLRVKTTGFRVGMGNGDGQGFQNEHDGMAWVDCDINAPYVNGMYTGGRRLAVMGCNIHDIVTSHVLRVWTMHKGVISNNRLWSPGFPPGNTTNGRHALKLHSGCYYDSGGNTCLDASGHMRPETYMVSITDNLLQGKSWSTSIGAQDDLTVETPHHILIERNHWFGHSSISIDLMVHASHTMVRNNLFDATDAGPDYGAVWTAHTNTSVPVEDDFRILNNTVYSGSSKATIAAVTVSGGPTNIVVRNNLLGHAGAPGVWTVDLLGIETGRTGGAGAGYSADHNLATTSPGFTTTTGGDFSLVGTSSPAAGNGISLPEVRQDFTGAARATPADIGAFNRH